AAQDRNRLEDELRRLERYHLLVVDEVGYLPLERQAANLLFALISRRYERGSIIVTSNRSFEQWGEILGDAMVAAALIDRLVHHATMVVLKGKSYRLKERAGAVAPAADQVEHARELKLPYPLLSDESLQLSEALGLPTFEFHGRLFYKRLTLIAAEGTIEAALYPVFPPDDAAAQVLDWLSRQRPV